MTQQPENGFTIAEISAEEFLTAYDEIKNMDSATLYSELEDAIGALNYVDMSNKNSLMTFDRGAARASALEFGLMPVSNLFRNVFTRLKAWICAHSDDIKKILNDVLSEKDKAAELSKLLQTAMSGIVAFISTIAPIVKIIVIVVQLLITYGLPALCPASAAA
jgi:predicted peroxiredoxin